MTLLIILLVWSLVAVGYGWSLGRFAALSDRARLKAFRDEMRKRGSS